MHFIIGLFLLCVILAVPALRAVFLVLLVLGGIGAAAVGGLLYSENQRDQARLAAYTAAHPNASIFDPPKHHSILVDENGNPIAEPPPKHRSIFDPPPISVN